MTLLSGLPLQKWTDIVKSQLKGKRQKQFLSALKSKNSDALYKLLGLGYSYFQDADGNFRKQVLVKLREEKFSGSIQAFRGLNDKNVSSQQVLKFENENNLAFDKGQPALRFSARYYNSGHSLGGTAANDIAVLLMTYLSP